VSMLFGALVNGGYAVSQVGIPQSLGFLLQGIILFFVLGIGDFLSRYRVVVSRQSSGVSSQPSAVSHQDKTPVPAGVGGAES
jgi:ABC-type uncharacterized transport system permease subunit